MNLFMYSGESARAESGKEYSKKERETGRDV